MEEGGDLDVLQADLLQPELLPDPHRPFRQSRAVHAGVEVLQVQHLVERADRGLPCAPDLLLQLLDPQRAPREGGPILALAREQGAGRGHWSSDQSVPEVEQVSGTGYRGAYGH